MRTSFPLHAAMLVCLASTSPSSAAIRYVNVNNASPISPYTNWATAANVIQDAVDVALPGDEVVVTNGVYQTGGRAVDGFLTNRVAVTKQLTLRSLNGPEVTVIRGYQVPGTTNGDAAVRCVYLTNGVRLVGFTITNGANLLHSGSGNFPRADFGGGVYCESNAVVSNCVIVGNAALRVGGGAYGGTLNDCTLSGNTTEVGGGAGLATLNRCTLTRNTPCYGGGAHHGALSNCTLADNRAAIFGGGASWGRITRCLITGNSAGGEGGGVTGASMINCTIVGNSAARGGGVAPVYFVNEFGPGYLTNASLLYNCIVYDNSARDGANYWGEAFFNYSCTTPIPTNGVGNISAEPQLAGTPHLNASSPCRGAGLAAYASGVDFDGESWANPPSMGCDEFTAGSDTGPLTVVLQASSSNVTAATEVFLLAQITGHATANRWEFNDGTVLSNRLAVTRSWSTPGNYPTVIRAFNQNNPQGVSATILVQVETGPLEVSIAASITNVATGFETECAGRIIGGVSTFRWEFGDGTVISNRLNIKHAWPAPGDYAVVLRAYNQSYPDGVTATQFVHVVEGVYYVAANSSNSAAPFTSWATAAATIQDAVDAAAFGGVVLVSNGVYQIGGRVAKGNLTNRVAVTKPLTVRSVNGPEATVIRGRQVPGQTNGDSAVRCFYLTNGATLAGFTLSNGATRNSGEWYEINGGGVYCESSSAVVSNCLLQGNSASYNGGGASGGTLRNCTLIANTANGGGGASEGTLQNCTLAGNSAALGGGVYQSVLNNCTVAGNTASWGGGACLGVLNNCTLTGNSALSQGGGVIGVTICGDSFCQKIKVTLNNCVVYHNTAPLAANFSDQFAIFMSSCTTPLPTNGIGNITNAPLFVDAAAGNLRLQSNSPCINAGRNASAPAGLDLDGNLRIAGGTVDIGAYEFQSPQSTLSYAWLQQYGLPTDGSADFADPDGDGHNNWQEWRAWTDPTNSASALRLLSPLSRTNGLLVPWRSVIGQNYFLSRSTNLSAPSSFVLLATNIMGQLSTTTFTDTNAAGPGPFFYRVEVRD